MRTAATPQPEHSLGRSRFTCTVHFGVGLFFPFSLIDTCFRECCVRRHEARVAVGSGLCLCGAVRGPCAVGVARGPRRGAVRLIPSYGTTYVQ